MTELINAKDIDFKTKIIGKQIADKHKGDKTPVVMVGLLNGCFAFYADLVRATPIDMECDFMRVKSYINRKQGDIVISKDLETPVKGKHVYIVDDIFDTGNTMKAITEYLEVKKPASITIVTLIVRKNSPTPPQECYHAFDIDEEWIIGMGMNDEKGHGRNYPSVYAL